MEPNFDAAEELLSQKPCFLSHDTPTVGCVHRANKWMVMMSHVCVVMLDALGERSVSPSKNQQASLRLSRAVDGGAVGGSVGFGVSKQNPAADGQAGRRFPRAAATVVRAPVPQFLDEIIEVVKLGHTGAYQQRHR